MQSILVADTMSIVFIFCPFTKTSPVLEALRHLYPHPHVLHLPLFPPPGSAGGKVVGELMSRAHPVAKTKIQMKTLNFFAHMSLLLGD